MTPHEAEVKTTTEHRSPAIYAAFHDPTHAESAAGALLDHGIAADRISLVMSEEARRRQGTADDPNLGYTQPTLVSGPAGATGRFDPLGNDIRSSTPTTISGGSQTLSDEEVGLNPALDDYPRDDSTTSAELASRPAAALTDFNKGLDAGSYNQGYRTDVERENDREAARERAINDLGDEGLDVNRPDNPQNAHEADRTIGPAAYAPERAAKHGVTTTTIADAASAAKMGVVAGLGVGALAAMAALSIPGIGLVIGGGALATALAGLAASAGAGAVAGGVVGYLKDQGVPGPDIPQYQRAYDDGGAILTVQLEDESERAAIEAIIRKYGAQTVERYGYAA